MQIGQATKQRGVEAPPLELLDLALESADEPEPKHDDNEEGSNRKTIMIVLAVVIALGGLTYMRSQSGAAAEPPVVTPVAAPTPEPMPVVAPFGLEGFSELYVSTYLTATGDDRQDAMEQFYPAAPDMDDRTVFDRYVTRSVVVDVDQMSADLWSLTIAAEVLTFDGQTYVLDGIHHYVVPVSTPEDRPFAATSLPSRVATPPAGDITAVASGTPVTDPGLHSLASDFVRSYTTGGDDVYRYTTAGFAAAAISPAPFTRITVEDMTSVQITSGLVQIRVAGIGIPESGAPIRIEYHLVAVVEGGAWKVDRLAPGPLTPGQLAEAEAAARSGSREN